ncbi:MAG: hypothetical protein IPN69_24080 [Acidobacteria bacterium]|nr:hypothetical protein [Acidobacteriota bacterium]
MSVPEYSLSKRIESGIRKTISAKPFGIGAAFALENECVVFLVGFQFDLQLGSDIDIADRLFGDRMIGN